MARLSLEGAVEILSNKGMEPVKQGKGFFIQATSQSFETGRELVKFVKEKYLDGFNREEAEKALQDMIDERERYNSLYGDAKEKGLKNLQAEYYRMAYNLEEKIEEAKCQLKNEGRLYTPNRVTSDLKKAGFEVEKADTTAVRGWHEIYGDFKVNIDYQNREILQVWVTVGNMRRGNYKAKKRDRLVEALEKAGYEVLEKSDSFITVNRVKK